MKKGIASLALFAFLFSPAALAADSGAAVSKAPRKEGVLGGKKVVKSRPKFNDCDKDASESLNLEEFKACFPRLGQQRFAVIDADRNGEATREELKDFEEARKAERRRELFGKCDTDKNGALSLAEFEQCEPAFKSRSAGRKR